MLHKNIFKVAVLSGSFLFFGCATDIQRAAIAPDADPAQEIEKIENEIASAETDHMAVLSPKDFRQSKRYLKEAKSDMADEQSREEILEDISYAKAYLQRARMAGEQRAQQIDPVLKARAAAVKAGAHRVPDLKGEFTRTDEEIKENSNDFRKNLSSGDISRLQNKYMMLELAAIQDRYLGLARSLVKDAKKNERAERRAPMSLKKAETELKSAESNIALNRYDLPGFSDDVIQANTSAQVLRDVLGKMNANKKINEPAALQLVRNEQQISRLRGTLGAAETELEAMDTAMRKQRSELQGVRSVASLQQSLAQAQKSFSEDEAEVFQKGNSLVVRLKKLDFASGSASLPRSSFPILSKVDGVITDLNSRQITIEGHTDSTGSNRVNQTLSEMRAEMVADYLTNNSSGDYGIKYLGFGEDRPIASNETKEGRSQNRRVDVVIEAGPSEDVVEPRLSEM